MNAALKSELATGMERIRYRLENPPAGHAGQAGARRTVTLPDAQRQMLEELGRAVESWRTSPEGRACLASPDGLDLEGLRLELNRLMKSPKLATTRERLSAQASVGDKIGFIPQAVSIGVEAQIDLVLGIYGSVGYAADLSDIDGSVVYLLGAIEEGVIEGGDVGVQVGVWKNSTNDMEGYYNGQNVDVDDFGGFVAFALEQDESVVAYLVDVAAGEDDGLAEDEYYCLTFDIEHLPVAQTAASHFLILTQLECLNTSESGHDEVYFYFQPDGGTTYRYPTWNYYAMSADSGDAEQIWNTGRSVMFNSYVNVTLKDGDDTLGSFTFSLGDFSGAGSSVPMKSDMNNGLDEIEYTMTAKLIY